MKSASRRVLFLLLFIGLGSSVHAANWKWYSDMNLAKEACFDEWGACSVGCFFACWSSNQYTPKYVSASCPAGVEPIGGQGVLSTGDSPGCEIPKADLSAGFSVGNETRQLQVGDVINVTSSFVNNLTNLQMQIDEITLAGFFISLDATFDETDTPLAQGLTVPPLAANGSFDTEQHAFDVPNLAIGTYHLLLVANYDQAIDETDLENNVYSWPFEILAEARPDLVAFYSTLHQQPVVLYPGGTITTEINLANASSADYDEQVKGYVYLSSDSTFSNDDRLLETAVSLERLPAGAQVDTELTLSVPENILAGTYQLMAVISPTDYLVQQEGGEPDQLEETYENNLSLFEVIIESPKLEIEICVGNPISTSSGRKLETEVDYQGTGVFPLHFARHYNSSPGNVTGWNVSYSERLLLHENSGVTDAILVFDSGMRYEFRDIDHRGYSDPDVPGFLSRTPHGYAYLDEKGTTHQFDEKGQLTGLVSLTGLTQSLIYSGEKLVQVKDHFGRSLHLDYNAAGLLSALRTPDDQTYYYRYGADGLLTSVTFPDNTAWDDNDNPTREFLYESAYLAHGLTGIIDENGNRYSSFDYDEQGRAILSAHQVNADRNTITYAENEATVTNALGKQTTYVFEQILGSRRLIRVDGYASANCPATSVSKTYDARGSVSQEVDSNGNITQYTYTHTGLPGDQYLYHVGLVTRITQAVGTPEQRTRNIEWHPEFRLPVKIIEPGRAILFTYDSGGRLVQHEEVAQDTGAHRTTRYQYNEQSQLVLIDGPRADVDDTTALSYSEQGDLVSITNALGHVTQILAHDTNGLPLAVQDPNGTITRVAYDARRRLVTQTVESTEGNVTTSIDYDAKGNLIAVHLPDGQTLAYTYDLADRLIAIANDLGELIEFTLDDDGNRVTELTKAADQSIVRVQNKVFDELSRLIQTIDAANQTARLDYDYNGNLDVIEDALNRQTLLSYDGLNRLVGLTDALQGVSTFTFDDRDNLTQVTDAEGVITDYQYDGLNNLLSEQSTAHGTTTYTYDDAGNRISTVDANNVEMIYSYDALNRMTSIQWPSSPEENVSYHYGEGSFAVGRLSHIADATGSTEFSYDDRGNVTADHRVIAGVEYTTRYGYNLADQLVRIQYPSGRIVHYQLDSLSRVTAISTQRTAASPVELIADEFDYLPYGPATSWQHGNGLLTSIGYDLDYRINSIDVNGRQSVQDLDYQYDAVSDITAMVDNLGLNDQQFGYDELNRLTSTRGNYGEISYRYDGVGNRLNRTIRSESGETVEDYQYESGSHRLLSVDTSNSEGSTRREFTHDSNGNTIGDDSSEHKLEMIVNARNRLEEVWKDGEQVGEYHYNALGQRVSKTSVTHGRLHAQFDHGNKDETPASHSTNNGKGNDKGKDNDQDADQSQASDDNLHSHYDNKKATEWLHFHYDQAGNLIAESDEQGQVIREYIYLGNYRLAMLATGIDQGSPQPNKKRKLELYYIHNDHLGTPNKITDAKQRVVWSMEQTPFGEVNLITEAIEMPMRFPGQYADLESGLNYNYFRDYDASIGRYVQSDPIGLRGGVNPYSYSEEQPTIKIDPFGRFGILGGMVGAVTGAITAYNTAVSSDRREESANLAAVGSVVGFGLGFVAGPTGIAEAGATGAAIGGTLNFTLSLALTGSVDPIEQLKATLGGFLTALTGNAMAFKQTLFLFKHASTKTAAFELGSLAGITTSGSLDIIGDQFDSLITELAIAIGRNTKECGDD